MLRACAMIRPHKTLLLALCLSLSIFSQTARAQSGQPASQPVTIAPQPQPSSQPTGTNDMSVKEWNAEDYEAAKPQLNLLELDGYFRLRGDFINNAYLGNDVFGTILQTGPNVVPPPINGYAASQNYRRLSQASSQTQAGANMRGRITPTLNITEDIQLIGTFDLFDNLVLGSLPDANGSGQPPVNVLSLGSSNPTNNLNTVQNAIALKRLYAKIATPLGELRFGRMPSQWGLGIFANSGDCLDCDYGDNVDRVAFVGMLGSFYIVPMLDFLSEGPTTNNVNTGAAATPGPSLTGVSGQARDLDQNDDATQLSLQLARKDAPDDIRDKLSRGGVVLNYGLWNMFRFQLKEATNYYKSPQNVSASDLTAFDSRDAFAYLVDGWFKLQYKAFTFEFEGIYSYARYKLFENKDNQAPVTGFAYNYARQWALAIDSRYDFTPNVDVRLRAGIASGDSGSPGFGVGTDAYSKGNSPYYGKYDSNIDNFQFNQDYRVDLLMFRQVIGTVTGAWYVKPEVSYTFANGLGGTFAPIYGQALFERTTPSQKSTPLGVELDAEIYYRPKKAKGFEASLAYGLLIPLDGLNRNLGSTTLEGTSVAHRLLGRVAVVF